MRTALPGVGPVSWLMASTSSWSGCGACWHRPRWPAPWRSRWSASWSCAACWRASPRPRVVEAWGCGRELQTARMQYTATSFAEPVQRVFDDVLRPVQDLDVSHVAESRYFVESVTFHNAVDDAIERGLYRPVIRPSGAGGRRRAGLQPGSVHRYLAYGLGALVLVLVALAVIG